MNSYKLRITLSSEIPITTYREMENRYFKSFVRCYEVGKDTGKKHYHYFIKTDSPNPLRQYIMNKIGRGNGFYSLKILKEEYPVEYLSYLLKEDENTVWCNMPDNIKENTLAYAAEVKHQIKTHRKEGKIGKLRKKIIEKYFVIPINPQQLLEEIVEIHIEERWVISKFQIQNYALTLLCEESETYRKKFIGDISQNF